jgi:hypothetical protein
MDQKRKGRSVRLWPDSRRSLRGDGQQGQYRDRTDEIRRRGGKLLKERQIVVASIVLVKGEMARSRSKLES